MKNQPVMSAGRIDGDLLAVPVGGEVGRVEQPHRPAVGADELGGNVDEVGLLAEVLHVAHQPPGPGDGVRLEEVGVHPGAGVPAVGHEHQELLERRVIGHGDAAHGVVPLEERLDPRKIGRPQGPPLSVAAGVELVRRGVVHGLGGGRHAKQVDLVAGDPARVPEAPLGIRRIGPMRDEVRLAVRGVLHVLPEIDEVG